MCAAETVGTVLPLINSIYCLSARRSVWSVSFLAKDREAVAEFFPVASRQMRG